MRSVLGQEGQGMFAGLPQLSHCFADGGCHKLPLGSWQLKRGTMVGVNLVRGAVQDSCSE